MRGLELVRIGAHYSGIFNKGAAEIVAHDPETQRLFVVSAAESQVRVLDLRDPENPVKIASLSLGVPGSVANSVDVHEGVLAVAVEAPEKTAAGNVVLLDTASLTQLANLEVGALPDMLAFSPNGRWLLVANEGEPSEDYLIDPEGSISIIDLSGGAASVTQADVRAADFRAFNDQRLPPGIRVFGPRASVAQDLEPEYLTVSADSRSAWVTLQENNALALVDIRSAQVLKLIPLGYKSHDQAHNALDASDKDDAIRIAEWPVRGLYQPDAIANYSYHGQPLLVLANEGDVRDYEGFNEERRIKELTLDPGSFPDAAELQKDQNLGRLKVTSTLGDSDGDGRFEELYSFGARSFSIRTADGSLLFDSGDDFERITAAALPEHFNASNDANKFDERSDDRGPEPEGLALGKISGRTYAFIGLERVGGIVTYDITNPFEPCFAAYTNSRDFTVDPSLPAAGDLGPEGLSFITAANSPNGKPLLIVGNEISGTTSIFEVRTQR